MEELIEKLDFVKGMLDEFRPNTSLGTIIKDYESRIKEMNDNGNNK